MKKFNRFFIMLAIFGLSTSATTTFAQTWQIGSPNAADVTATLASGTLTISGTGAMQNFTQGGAPWYNVRTGISVLKLMYGINNIGDYAFYDCEHLTSNFTIPSSVHGIGASAFYLCGFNSLTIPQSVVAIDNSAFYNCSHLTSIACVNASPANITLGTQVFGGVPSTAVLRVRTNAVSAYQAAAQWNAFTVQGPTTLWNIGTPTVTSVTAQFLGNTLLISGSGKMQDYTLFDLPWYGGEPWYNNRSVLTAFTIENGVTNIGQCAFQGCAALQDASDIPGSVTSIGANAFQDCTGLMSVIIPGSVTLIDLPFVNCSKLPSVFIPSSVTSITAGSFSECTALTAIDVSMLNTNYSSTDGILFNKNKSSLLEYPGGKTGAYTIPNTVTSIGDAAFYHCIGLYSVNIPTSVVSIGYSAFYNCTNLMALTSFNPAPENITLLGNAVFSGVSAESYLYVPAAAIPAYQAAPQWSAFNPHIQGPQTWNIGATASDHLTGTYFGGVLTISGTGAMYDYDYMEDPTPWNGHDSNCFVQSISMGSGITHIGDCAFATCYYLTDNVTVPNTVTSIGMDAFYYCNDLTAVTMQPNSVTTIAVGAFVDCYSLTSINIPNSVVSIGTNAFGGCNAMTAINVDAGNNYFSSEDGVLFNKDKSTLVCCPAGKGGNYTIPGSVASIGYAAFSGCSILKTVTLPASVLSIGMYAFDYCSGLTALNIPASVASIGQFAFDNCRSMTAFTIPASVSSIGQYAFNSCTGLTSITCLNPVPLSGTALGVNVFNMVDKTTCELNVPVGSYDAYHTANQWKDFLIINEITTGIENVNIPNLKLYPNPVKDVLYITAESPINRVEIFNMDGKMQAAENNFIGEINLQNLSTGIYLVKVYSPQGTSVGKIIKN